MKAPRSNDKKPALKARGTGFVVPPEGGAREPALRAVKVAPAETLERVPPRDRAAIASVERAAARDRQDQSYELGGVGDAPISNAAEDDADFSEEFGFERGYAGGSGFEGVEFDKWI